MASDHLTLDLKILWVNQLLSTKLTLFCQKNVNIKTMNENLLYKAKVKKELKCI